MIRRIARLWRADGGSAAVEFAAVLAPLMLMIFGVEEYGRLLWAREALQETATAAARCMGMSASSCASSGAYSASATDTYVENQATNWGLTLTSSNIALNSNTTCAGVTATNGFSTVTLSYSFTSVVPRLATGIGGGESLSTTSCFPNY
jgi:Flp pilus assembly protein TadG